MVVNGIRWAGRILLSSVDLNGWGLGRSSGSWCIECDRKLELPCQPASLHGGQVKVRCVPIAE